MSARQPDVLAIGTIRQDLEAAENANDPDALAVHLADDSCVMTISRPAVTNAARSAAG